MIIKTQCNYEIEPYKFPFGFKGGYLNDAWQTCALVVNDAKQTGLGTGVQSVLWSDAGLFEKFGNDKGNAAMFEMTRHGLELLKNTNFATPVEALEYIFPLVYKFGQNQLGYENLRETFALNALVPVDNAVWQLYGKEKGVTDFDGLIPYENRLALQCRHDKLAVIPLCSYKLSVEEIGALVDDGYFFFKIKVGSDPDSDRDQQKMLEWDKKRITEIHSVLKDKKTAYSVSGEVPYYLDANGRYENKDTLLRLLDHCDKIGALNRIVIFEEPFPEDYLEPVHDIPVRLAADESAHTDKDAVDRIDLGYGAIALKPIAKTLSMSLKIAAAAVKRDIPCFCADLTVNPVLLDWNKNVAARLKPLPELKIGVLESNGHQNYRDWDKMLGYHPLPGASWLPIKNGVFELDDTFYAAGGGTLDASNHFVRLAGG